MESRKVAIMFLNALNAAVNLIGDHLVEKNSSEETNKQAMSVPTNAIISIEYGGKRFSCEECLGWHFKRLSKIKARCADCGTVYSIAFESVKTEVVYYEG